MRLCQAAGPAPLEELHSEAEVTLLHWNTLSRPWRASAGESTRPASPGGRSLCEYVHVYMYMYMYMYVLCILVQFVWQLLCISSGSR